MQDKHETHDLTNNEPENVDQDKTPAFDEKKFERQTGIKLLHLNSTIESYFGGIFNKAAHQYLINTTILFRDVDEISNLDKDLILLFNQEEHDQLFLRLYMNDESLPTEKKNSFSCDTKDRNNIKIRLPPLKYNISWYIVIKPSSEVGFFSQLNYSLTLIESNEDNFWTSGNMIILYTGITIFILGSIVIVIRRRKIKKEEKINVPQRVNFLHDEMTFLSQKR